MSFAFSAPMVFVDIETTGGRFSTGRVLEIAAIRVENNQIVDTFVALLNPIGYVPNFITELTGITTDDVSGMSKFEDVAERLSQIMDGAIFVAHNVRFDYSFVRREFARLDMLFTPKLLCTVKLSRMLYPTTKGHSLQALIDRHGFFTESRHRAYDDAEVLWQFYKVLLRDFDLETLERAIATQFKRQSLPQHLKEADIQRLPDSPGVYIFESDDATPLYIGKSVNIRQRVLSHFHDDMRKSSEFQISQNVKRISFEQTTGELGALLLESKLIKERLPLHNKRLRRIKELVTIIQTTTDHGYFGVSFEQNTDMYRTLGLFRSKIIAKRSLLYIASEHNLCKKLLGLEKTSRACFDYQLGKCFGACIKEEDISKYNARFDVAFEQSRIKEWPYEDAILITEKHPFVPGATAYLINQWQLVAILRENSVGEVSIHELRQDFDLDAYKILAAYLRSPLAARTVRSVKEEDILAFLEPS